MKKLGVWLPTRPKLRKIDNEKPGIFLDAIGKVIVKELKKDFVVIEDLDFRKASVVNGKVYFNGYDAEDLDGYLWFSHMDKNTDGHDMLVLQQLEKTMPVINPSKGLIIGLDKFKTSSFLKANNIPVPEFALVRPNDEKTIRKMFQEWKSVLVKPRYGGFGIGIFKADDADGFMDIIDYSQQETVYVEKFYENDHADWCGINVVGNKILYGYGKESSKIKGYKVFDRAQQGGKMINHEPNSFQREIALDVAKKTGMDFFGVDIIKTYANQYLVVDMNTFPGIYPDMAEPEFVASEFCRMIKLRLNKRQTIKDV
ncbi:TPA: hypothetical protein HA246_07505 [Candidatus Woesearchaeota archaeon]|nr:hypothetical protein [Candidatus Woesearchaeota archaeon]